MQAETPDQSSFGTVVRTRALVIFGLAGMAVTQPLLGLFGSNPEFFVAGNYTSAQVIAFALIVMALPAVIGTALVAAVAAIDRRAGTITFVVVVGLLGAALVLVVLRRTGIGSVVLALGLIGGAAVVWLVLRTTPGRLLASYLAVANVLFVGLFVFASQSSELVFGASNDDIGEVSVPAVGGPVVVVVLDEFPAATIMRGDGTINADRYPGFADLASVSTWYRNASTQDNLTHRSVPSILDGRLPDDDDLPIVADHPRSLFTLLGPEMPIVNYESVTDLCPDEFCGSTQSSSLMQALEDASIVYGHRVLPGSLRDGLPEIDNSWGSFGADTATGGGSPSSSDPGQADRSDRPTYIEQAYTRWTSLGADERSPSGQAGIMQDQIGMITDEPAVHFAHVAMPHRPWVLSRTGVTSSYVPELIRDPADPAYEFETRLEFQIHSMQVGAADGLITELLDTLRSLPDWDETLLVVTSDHGTNLTGEDFGRMRVTDANREEVYRVPLFIKAPGQTDGLVDDQSAQSLDVLPSIVDLLDIEADWEFDGHSLYDGSVAHTEPQVSTDVDAVLDIARDRSAQFPNGDDWVGLAAVGDHGELVGRDVDEFAAGDPSEWSIALRDAELFASLPSETGQAPFALTGTVTGSADPPELLVAINGRLAGVVGGYRPDGDEWSFYGYVADLYREGSNEVTVYEVAGDGDDVTLREVAQP